MNTEDPIYMQFQRLVSRGRELLDEWQKEGVMESEILDFKLTEKGGTKLHDKDSKNLSKSLSGFANSGGGILVWGVECNRDKKGVDQIVALPGLAGLKSFHSSVLTNYPGFTSPGAQGVEVQAIDVGGDSGFLVMYIPKGESNPLMATAGDLHRYYYRSGPSFKPMPEWMIADRYGRRPQPKLELVWRRGDATNHNRIGLELGVRNQGRGVARDIVVKFDTNCAHPSYRAPDHALFSCARFLYQLPDERCESNAVWHGTAQVPSGFLTPVVLLQFNSREDPKAQLMVRCEISCNEGISTNDLLLITYGQLMYENYTDWLSAKAMHQSLSP